MNEQQISGGFLILLRLTLGFSFLTTWISNLTKGAFTSAGFIDTISYFIDSSDHIVTPFDTIIRTVAFPNAALFGFGWMIVELLIALTLIFGVLTRLGSILGAGSTIILGLGALGVDWPWTYALLFVGFVTCALVGAGRWFGVDFFLKDMIPERFEKYAKFLL
ncbi:MAG: TQO small subunit DoxD [Promethearchaeota archaeon]